jgi:hypothetical protein
MVDGVHPMSAPHRGVLGTQYRLDTTAGQKRMANGHVKPPSSASPNRKAGTEYLRQMDNGSPQRSPQRSPQIGHVRII